MKRNMIRNKKKVCKYIVRHIKLIHLVCLCTHLLYLRNYLSQWPSPILTGLKRFSPSQKIWKRFLLGHMKFPPGQVDNLTGYHKFFQKVRFLYRVKRNFWIFPGFWIVFLTVSGVLRNNKPKGFTGALIARNFLSCLNVQYISLFKYFKMILLV